eukprot:5360554-Amphidinium_carterae.1
MLRQTQSGVLDSGVHSWSKQCCRCLLAGEVESGLEARIRSRAVATVQEAFADVSERPVMELSEDGPPLRGAWHVSPGNE